MTERSELSTAFTRVYPAGTVLFEEHDPGSRMYVIRRGRVRIYRKSGENEMVLAILGPGEFFGEMALLEDLPRSANAQAVEECELIEVEASTFAQMLKTSPEIAVRMMRRLAARVRELDLRLQNLLLDSGVGRSLEVLRWLLSKGKPEGAFVRLAASVVHIGIAAQAGIPPHEVQQVYDRLRQAGCLREDGAEVLVANTDTLDAYSQFLELKRRYDPVQALGGADATGEREKSIAMQRLLKALQIEPREMEQQRAALSSQYSRYLELRRRFEWSKGTPG